MLLDLHLQLYLVCLTQCKYLLTYYPLWCFFIYLSLLLWCLKYGFVFNWFGWVLQCVIIQNNYLIFFQIDGHGHKTMFNSSLFSFYHSTWKINCSRLYLKMFWVLECYLQIWWPSGSQNALCSNKSTARNLPSELRGRWLLRLLIHLLVYPVHYVNQTGECGYDCIFMKCNLKNLSLRTI